MTTQIKALSKELYEQKINPNTALHNLRKAINETIANCKCAWCDVEYVPGFRDELSRKEYQISALCQQCQDEVFGLTDEERQSLAWAEHPDNPKFDKEDKCEN